MGRVPVLLAVGQRFGMDAIFRGLEGNWLLTFLWCEFGWLVGWFVSVEMEVDRR